MEPVEGASLGPTAGESESAPPPEFLNPESPRYQPWAEKQITNAVKEKRPLAEFMREFDATVAAYGELASGSWDPQHQERLLARFAPARPGPAPGRRRRHRRPGGGSANPAPSPGSTSRRPVGQTPVAAAPPSPGQGGDRRRRRRRRSRAGRKPPEAGTGA